MQTAERLAYLELALTPHVGAMSFLKLLQAFPNASAVWSNSSTHLHTLISQKAVAAIFGHQGLAALQAAINSFGQRERRFGRTSEQLPEHEQRN